MASVIDIAVGFLSLSGSSPKCYWPQSHLSLENFVCSPPSWITLSSKVLTWACFHGQAHHLEPPPRSCPSWPMADFCTVWWFILEISRAALCFCYLQPWFWEDLKWMKAMVYMHVKKYNTLLKFMNLWMFIFFHWVLYVLVSDIGLLEKFCNVLRI